MQGVTSLENGCWLTLLCTMSLDNDWPHNEAWFNHAILQCNLPHHIVSIVCHVPFPIIISQSFAKHMWSCHSCIAFIMYN